VSATAPSASTLTPDTSPDNPGGSLIRIYPPVEGLGKVLAVAAEMVEEERSLLGTGEATSSHDAGYRRLAVQPARG
jgi:hypothetical protein